MKGELEGALSRFGWFADPGTVLFDRRLPHPPATVWDALTDERQWPLWFFPYAAHLDIRPGGSWLADEPGEPAERTFWGHVLECRTNERLELSWGDGPSSMWFELTAAAPVATNLRFGHRLNAHDAVSPEDTLIGYGWGEQPLGPGTFQPGLADAWHGHLDRLEAYLDGQPVPPLGATSRENVDYYRALILAIA